MEGTCLQGLWMERNLNPWRGASRQLPSAPVARGARLATVNMLGASRAKDVRCAYGQGRVGPPGCFSRLVYITWVGLGRLAKIKQIRGRPKCTISSTTFSTDTGLPSPWLGPGQPKMGRRGGQGTKLSSPK